MSVADLTAYPMVPGDESISPEEDLALSIAGQLGVSPATVPLADEKPVPIGRTWEFDFESGRFVRQGGAPVPVTGVTTLAQWCLMAVHTARFQYAAFSEAFGMEDPGDEIGEFPIGEILTDFETHLTEALLVHDRITSVDNLTLDWDPVQGVLTIETVDVITDEPDFAVTIQGVQIGGF